MNHAACHLGVILPCYTMPIPPQGVHGQGFFLAGRLTEIPLRFAEEMFCRI
jgi:hypothetical protein